MQKGFNKIYSVSMLLFPFWLFLSSLFFVPNLYPQSPTNLEQFYSLTDSLTNQVFNELPDDQDKILLTQNLGEQYSLFSNHIKTAFIKSGIEISSSHNSELSLQLHHFVNIVIEGATVEYGEMFRDGWFGAHHVKRKCTLSGNFLHSYSEGMKNFNFSLSDTVKVEDIKILENESFPFTKGKIPPEPFLSGIAEPIIAIGIAAAVVILFFSVRSK